MQNWLKILVDVTYRAHSEFALSEKKSVRRFDGRTPYAIHPIWCALTILAETTLEASVRETGAHVLFLHDVLEDTTMALPEDTPAHVIELVKEMTYVNGFADEKVQIWAKSNFVKLLKLYDKVSNMMDSGWMNPEKKGQYSTFVKRLAEDVGSYYGDLNIVKMAYSLV